MNQLEPTDPAQDKSRFPTKSLPGLGGWGRFPTADSLARRPEKFKDLIATDASNLARGLGRSYGDAALNSNGVVILTERLNRLLEFDSSTGIVRAEAGLTLQELLNVMVPYGWFVPVTPGTKQCTLGGCFAADVHGKNHHHDGTFSIHVHEIELAMASGEVVRLNQESNLFWATAGGMGLTGIIRELTIQLIPVETAYMKVKHTKTRDLAQTVDLLSDPKFDAHYTVAWVDCLATGPNLGRGILMTGEHAKKSDISLRIKEPLVIKPKKQKPFPIDLPGFALNPLTIKFFNSIYGFFQGRRGEFVCTYNEFFYPLDGIQQWNRMYGKRGFVQYQYVLPTKTALAGTKEILEKLSREKKASFLAVLKRFGPEGQGLLSFPMEGLTLALDIPMSDNLMPFLDHLDDIVMRYGGRIYLAKDSRMKPEVFESGYGRIAEFCHVKSEIDPGTLFNSDLAKRIGLCQ